jgi:hypothetical protein
MNKTTVKHNDRCYECGEANGNGKMSSLRRTFLRRSAQFGGAAALTSLAGCTSLGIDDGEDYTKGEISIPNPVISSLSLAEPVITETVDINNNYFAKVENQGDTGEVLVELYWVTDFKDDSEEPDESTLVKHTSGEVEADEMREFKMTADQPNDANGFWFAVGAHSVTATMRNSGGAGEVIVSLIENDEVVDEQTVEIASDAESNVTLTRENTTNETDLEVTAEPVEQ